MAYMLYARSVCDMNSISEIVSGQYATQLHLLTYTTESHTLHYK